MRTNIVLDDDLVREAQRYSRTKTKRALIEEALKSFVEVKEEARRRATYRERIEPLQRKLSAIRLRESPSSVLRADRARA